MNWNPVHILDKAIEMTCGIKFVDQVTGSAGCSKKQQLGSEWVPLDQMNWNSVHLLAKAIEITDEIFSVFEYK
jgi:hypothetical protein